MDIMNVTLTTNDVPVPQSFTEFLEEESGLELVYLVLLFAVYAMIAIGLLLIGIYGACWRPKVVKKSTEKTALKTNPVYKTVKAGPEADSWTENFDENYMSNV